LAEERLPSRLVFGYAYPFLFAVVLGLAARGETIFGPLYSSDTYGQALQPYLDPGFYNTVLRQGRFGLVPLYWLREVLGYQGAGVAVSALLLSVLLFAHSGLLFAQVILRRPSTAEMTLFLALFTLHPFATEFFHFTDATLVIAVAMWLASAGVYLAARSSRTLPGLVGGVILIALALSMYQTAISFVVTVCLLAVVVRIARLEPSEGGTLRQAPQVRAWIAAVVSVPVYLLAVRIVSLATGEPSATTQLLGLSSPIESLRLVSDFVRTAVVPWPAITPRAATLVLLALLALSALTIAGIAYRRRSVVAALVCGGLLAAGLVWAAAAPSVTTTWLVPRVLVGISVFIAGVIMLGWRSAGLIPIGRPVVVHGLLGAGVVLLLISYIGASNRILADQRRLNVFDLEKANRIVARWEEQPGFRHDLPLAVVGGGAPYPSISTAIGDMNYSALYVPWAKNGLFEIATGYRFGRPTEEQQALAQAYCEAADPWPAPGSAVVEAEIALVCLPS
jgi:hypothetical protein